MKCALAAMGFVYNQATVERIDKNHFRQYFLLFHGELNYILYIEKWVLVNFPNSPTKGYLYYTILFFCQNLYTQQDLRSYKA